MKTKKSPRKELGQYAGSGDLRQLMEQSSHGLSAEAIDLLVRIVLNYCER